MLGHWRPSTCFPPTSRPPPRRPGDLGSGRRMASMPPTSRTISARGKPPVCFATPSPTSCSRSGRSSEQPIRVRSGSATSPYRRRGRHPNSRRRTEVRGLILLTVPLREGAAMTTWVLVVLMLEPGAAASGGSHPTPGPRSPSHLHPHRPRTVGGRAVRRRAAVIFSEPARARSLLARARRAGWLPELRIRVDRRYDRNESLDFGRAPVDTPPRRSRWEPATTCATKGARPGICRGSSSTRTRSAPTPRPCEWPTRGARFAASS